MVEKRISCPNCNKLITVKGEPGETKYITCPKCNEKGKFTFKKDYNEDKTKELAIIDVKNLTKKFRDLVAVNNISFSVKKGEIFGFLGPNGAGKTTTIKAILGLIKYDKGFVKINGKDVLKDPKEVKKNVGYLPEKVSFYDKLSALQNLNFYAELKNISKDKCLPLIEEFGLGEYANKKVGQYSKGMRQRLGLARALLGDPNIIFLDEPASGLDPRGVKWIRNKIKQLNKNGVTIFISSHILSEIQAVSTQVGIINKGVLVAQDSVDNLGEKLKIKPKLILKISKIDDKVKKIVKKIKGVDRVEISENELIIYCDLKLRSKVIVAIENAGIDIENINTEQSSLEDVFMKYTEGN